MQKAIAADSSAKPALATTLVALDLVVPEEEPVSLVGPAVATAPTPPVTGPLSVSVGAELPRALAADWNTSKVFPVAGALILPTIPVTEQCVGALQWNQMGFVSVTLIVNVAGLVTRPESNPAAVLELLAAKYVHGLANEDSVTECGMAPPGK